MTTTLRIDENLLNEAMKIRRTRNREKVFQEALELYIERRKRLRITRWFGKVDFVAGYEPRRLRKKTKHFPVKLHRTDLTFA